MSATVGFTDVISEKTIELLARGNDATTGRLTRLFHDLVTPAFHTLDHWAQFGLLPLCLALLILHENHRAVTEGGVFRLGHVLGRAVAIVAIVLSYDQVCGLITGVAGAGGGWVSGDQYLDHVGNSNQALGSAWTNIVSDDSWVGVKWDNLPRFLALLFIWVIVMITALFAYVSGLLLSMSQAVLLTIIAAVGKTCIVVSLVPGVGVGKSWARSLAQVAAWSTIAGVISTLVLAGSGNIQGLVASGNLLGLLKASAEFVIVGVCMLAVPAISSRILSGGGQVAVGVAGALAVGYAGAKMAAGGVAGRGAHTGQGSKDSGGDASRNTDRSGGSEEGGGRRAHKAPQEVAPTRKASPPADGIAPPKAARQEEEARTRGLKGTEHEDATTKAREVAPATKTPEQHVASAEGPTLVRDSHERPDLDEARTPHWPGRPRGVHGGAAPAGPDPVTRVRPVRVDGAMPPSAAPGGASVDRAMRGSASGGPVRLPPPPLASASAGSSPERLAGGGAASPRAGDLVGGRPRLEPQTVHTSAPTAAHAGASAGARQSGGGSAFTAGEIDASGKTAMEASSRARAEPAPPGARHDSAVDATPRRAVSPNVIPRQPPPLRAEDAPPPRKREAPTVARDGDTQP